MDLSLGAVFLAGFLTFLSPCVLPLVPVYLSILGGGPEAAGGRWRPLLATSAFALGFGLVFSLLGLSATMVGRALLRHKDLFQQVAGLVVLLLGLRFMGYLRLPFLPEGTGAGRLRWKTRFHLANAFLLGLLFAFAWTPCVGSILGAVLTYASLATTDPVEGMGWLFVYSLGFATPLLVAAAFAGPVLQALRQARRFLPLFEKVTGTLLVIAGFLLITDQWGLVDSAFTREPEPPSAAVTLHPDRPVSSRQVSEGTCSDDAATCTAQPASERPVVLKFYAPNCPICLQMIPIVNTLRNECAAKDLDFRDVDVTTPEGKVLAREYGVSGVPVFLFLDATGREVSRLVGYQSLQALEQAASVLIGEACPGFRPLPDLSEAAVTARPAHRPGTPGPGSLGP